MSDRSQRDQAGNPSSSFYESLFTEQELADIGRQLQPPRCSTAMEVAVMRVMIRRVMDSIGTTNPARALPLIRQGVDSICRALRTDRLLTGEASDSLAAAFAVALREIGEELGLGNR